MKIGFPDIWQLSLKSKYSGSGHGRPEKTTESLSPTQNWLLNVDYESAGFGFQIEASKSVELKESKFMMKIENVLPVISGNSICADLRQFMKL